MASPDIKTQVTTMLRNKNPVANFHSFFQQNSEQFKDMDLLDAVYYTAYSARINHHESYDRYFEIVTPVIMSINLLVRSCADIFRYAIRDNRMDIVLKIIEYSTLPENKESNFLEKNLYTIISQCTSSNRFDIFMMVLNVSQIPSTTMVPTYMGSYQSKTLAEMCWDMSLYYNCLDMFNYGISISDVCSNECNSSCAVHYGSYSKNTCGSRLFTSALKYGSPNIIQEMVDNGFHIPATALTDLIKQKPSASVKNKTNFGKLILMLLQRGLKHKKMTEVIVFSTQHCTTNTTILLQQRYCKNGMNPMVLEYVVATAVSSIGGQFSRSNDPNECDAVKTELVNIIKWAIENGAKVTSLYTGDKLATLFVDHRDVLEMILCATHVNGCDARKSNTFDAKCSCDMSPVNALDDKLFRGLCSYSFLNRDSNNIMPFIMRVHRIGVNVRSNNNEGILNAAKNGNQPLFAFLAENGALDLDNDQRTILLLNAICMVVDQYAGKRDIMKHIVDTYNPDLNYNNIIIDKIVSFSSGSHWSSGMDFTRCLDDGYLVEKGFDLAQRNNILMKNCLIHRGYSEIKMLTKAGCNIDDHITPNERVDCLKRAIARKDIELITLLLKKGVNPNLVDFANNTKIDTLLVRFGKVLPPDYVGYLTCVRNRFLNVRNIILDRFFINKISRIATALYNPKIHSYNGLSNLITAFV
jgi:hypothetical protein